MINPLEIAELTGKIVCKNNQRKYYRFRSSRFYGGIATADCVGCCLRCIFCCMECSYAAAGMRSFLLS